MPILRDRLVILQVNPEIGPGFEVRSLRITFSVVHSNDGKPNTATIEVYNLNPATRKWMKALGRKVILEAGHGRMTGLLFFGDLSYANIERRGEDVVLKMECGDGEEDILRTRLELAWETPVDTTSIITAIAATMGMEVGWNDTIPETLPLGITMSGTAEQYLDAICDQLEARWSVQDGVLQILRDGGALPNLAVPITSPGILIGSPSDITKKNRREETEVVGVKVVTLLQPSIRPGRLVTLATKDYQGLYVVQKVTHAGDNGWDTAYYSELELEEFAA